MTKRVISMRVLDGQPTDGTGQVCVHLFVQDERGKFVEPHVLHPLYEGGERVKQRLEARPARGRIACNPKLNPAPTTRGGVTAITSRTDDPRAVTCPKCRASKEYADLMVSVKQ